MNQRKTNGIFGDRRWLRESGVAGMLCYEKRGQASAQETLGICPKCDPVSN